MISFQRFGKGDLPSLPELTSLCFGRSSPPAFFHWKYFENPEGNVIAYTAKNENGKMVGFWGIIPDAYYLNNDKTTVYHVCDSMTHPTYRRHGIFERLAGLACDELRQQGKLLAKVFPGPMAHSAYAEKLGWMDFGRIRPSFKISWQVRLEGILHRSTSPYSTHQIVDSDRIREDINEIDRVRSIQFPIMKTRDKVYLDWRLREPGLKHSITYWYPNSQLKGYCITTIENKSVLLIKDIFAENMPGYKILLGRIFQMAVDNHLRGVYCWSNEGSFFSKLLRQNLFVKNPFNRGVMSHPLYFALLADTAIFPAEFIYNKANWHLLPIDYDG